jgi:predicted small integral membrane protein
MGVHLDAIALLHTLTVWRRVPRMPLGRGVQILENTVGTRLIAGLSESLIVTHASVGQVVSHIRSSELIAEIRVEIS